VALAHGYEQAGSAGSAAWQRVWRLRRILWKVLSTLPALGQRINPRRHDQLRWFAAIKLMHFGGIDVDAAADR